MSEDRADDAALLLTPIPPQGDKGNEGNHPPCEGVEGDSDSLVARRRIWQKWETGEWRTDFPPPPGFAGHQQGEWEEQGYWRQLSEDELAALVAAGIAEPDAGEVAIEDDEAERDAFFAGLNDRASGDA